jgi:hypothetical protein
MLTTENRCVKQRKLSLLRGDAREAPALRAPPPYIVGGGGWLRVTSESFCVELFFKIELSVYILVSGGYGENSAMACKKFGASLLSLSSHRGDLRASNPLPGAFWCYIRFSSCKVLLGFN